MHLDAAALPDDPIVAEVRAQRDAIAAAVEYDLDALFARVKSLEVTERTAGRVILPPSVGKPGAVANSESLL